ncbi:MAG: transposase [Rickettsiella sp.]|nr:transposase [Rickettsiella sp.]
MTGIKNTMKNKLISLIDKVLLKKRVLIESVFNQLKNSFQMEHS